MQMSFLFEISFLNLRSWDKRTKMGVFICEARDKDNNDGGDDVNDNDNDNDNEYNNNNEEVNSTTSLHRPENPFSCELRTF